MENKVKLSRSADKLATPGACDLLSRDSSRIRADISITHGARVTCVSVAGGGA